MRKIIILTPPFFFANEVEIITTLLDNGLSYLHIRKPESKEADVLSLLNRIPSEYYPQIVLHDHHQLAQQIPVGGIHLNRRDSSIPHNYGGRISCSCHSFNELEKYKEYDYLFLSPIFNSISKKDYKAAFSIDELREASKQGIIHEKVIALGGISNSNIDELAGINFGGYVLYGSVWGFPQKDSPKEDVLESFLEVKHKVKKHEN